MNIRKIFRAVATVGLLLAASCSPTIMPIPAPQSKPDTSAYSTKAAGDATVLTVQALSPYFFELVAVDGVPLASYTQPGQIRSSGLPYQYGTDGWRTAFLSPGYHCVTASIRNFRSQEDHSKWSSFMALKTACFDARSGHTYALDARAFKRFSGTLEIDAFPTLTDTGTGKVVLPVPPGNPDGPKTAIVSFSGGAPLASIDGLSIYDGSVKRTSLGKFLSPTAIVIEISPGYHTVTSFGWALGVVMAAYDFPAGRDIRIVTRKEGLVILDAATGNILKSPGSET